ncbi:MAG: rhomboid family intramembrane serine protease [Bacteroidetes bacterium]|nr:rhomboid family intramembrane serine protease [Bacteroidota bacterium]
MKDFKFIFKRFIASSSVVNRILLINIGLFISFSVFKLIMYLFNLKGFSEQIISYLYVPGNAKLLIYRPWTLLTYQFMHVDFFHILFNMLMFYYMAIIYNNFLKSQGLWKIYLWGGISGAIVFLLSFNFFPVFRNTANLGYLVGASASVMAVVAATATLVPDFEVFLFGLFRIKLKWLAFALILIDISGIPTSNPGGGLAHLGGTLFGFVYMLNYKGYFNLYFKNFNKYFAQKTKVDEKKIFRKKVYVNQPHQPNSNAKNNKNTKPNQLEIDAILDKISQSGYDSLTKSEKDTLFRASE